MNAAAKTHALPQTWQAELQRQFPVILGQECARWGFVLRAALAAFMALGISMLLELAQPVTAMITALVVIQPQSGAVLSKSFYRMAGSLTGGVVAVLLFALFAQQTPLLLAGMCLWVGLCTTGSMRRRNFQSYGFVLSGYTACIIALPMLNTPEHIVIAAILRVSEVFVGIFCAALTSEVVFPKAVHNTLYAAAEECFVAFTSLTRSALAGNMQPEDVERMLLRFIRDVGTLDSYGASAAFEAERASEHSRVRLFNAGLMAVSTSFHALYAFAVRAGQADNERLRGFFRAILTDAAERIAPSGFAPRAPKDAQAAAAALGALTAASHEQQADLLQTGGFLPEERRLLENGMHLLRRFLADMRAYLVQYASLNAPGTPVAPAAPMRNGSPDDSLSDPEALVMARSARFSAGTDKSIALVAGLRAGLILAMLLSFWRATEWSNGADAAVFAVIFCALQAAAPNPTRSILFSTVGCVFGAVAGVAYSFLVLPAMSDFVPMCAGLFPFLAVGPYLMTVPAAAGVGRSYNFMFASFASPGLIMSIDPVALIGGGLGKLVGIMLAGVMLAVFLPSGGSWWKRRLHHGLLREGAHACHGRHVPLLPRFESGVRNILLQYITSYFTTEKEKQAMLKNALAVGNIGRVIIEIRRNIRMKIFTPAQTAMLAPIIAELRRVLEKPNFARYRALLARIQNVAQKLEETESAGAGTRAAEDAAAGSAATLTRILQLSLMRMAEELRMLEPADAGAE